jgi:hypothetical protein
MRMGGEILVRPGPGERGPDPHVHRHTFAHRGPGRARFLNAHTPDSGFAEYLRGVSRGREPS